MQRFRMMVLAGRTAFALLLLAFAALAACALIQGPVTAYRIVVHGDTTIDDHRLYPSRALAPSPRPVVLTDAPYPGLASIPGVHDPGSLLERSDSIAFLVVQGDRLVVERYFQGHARGRMSQVFSTSKSVLSLLVGMAIDDGLIASVEAPVSRYVPELAAAGFDRVRVLDLLHMRTNLDYVEDDNPFGRHVRFNYTPRLLREILALRIKDTPDPAFVYKSGDTAVLALVLQRALHGRTLTAYTQERLWNPLGMQDAGLWSLDREGGLEKAWCCLAASARDLAKIGMLARDGGSWRGRQLVSRDWVERSTRDGGYDAGQWNRTPLETREGFRNYAYQWWLVEGARGDFMSRGKDGQFIYVDRRTGTVIVRLGRTHGGMSPAQWIALFRTVADGTRPSEVVGWAGISDRIHGPRQKVLVPG